MIDHRSAVVFLRGGDLSSSTAFLTLYYRVEQIRKCDMGSVHNRQQSG